jgi:hypothetical protein
MEHFQITIHGHQLLIPHKINVQTCHRRYRYYVLPVLDMNQRHSLLCTYHLQLPRPIFQHRFPP